MKSSKQTLNQGLIFKKAHRMTGFIQDELLKIEIEINVELRQNAENNF